MSSKQLAHLSLPLSLAPSPQTLAAADSASPLGHRLFTSWSSLLPLFLMLASAEMYLLGQTERQRERESRQYDYD